MKVMQEGLHERLAIAVENRSYRQIGDLTGTHPETVRRYMQGQAPSAEFLAGVCTSMGISAEWLLLGKGPQLTADIRGHALSEASAADLLTAISQTLEGLIGRVDRVEVFMQTLETKLHGARALLLSGEAARADGAVLDEEDVDGQAEPKHTRARSGQAETKPTNRRAAGAQAGGAADPIGGIADAVAE